MLSFSSHPFGTQQEKDSQPAQVPELLSGDDGEGKGKKGRGKRARVEDASLDEKRLKFLERNRAAATRCREKKKHWMQELQQKANTLSVANSQMQVSAAVTRPCTLKFARTIFSPHLSPG